MKVLCLLASLCLLPACSARHGFQNFLITCEHENAQCNNTCEWNITLEKCPTLQIHCSEVHGKDPTTGELLQKTICNSFEECNLTKPLKFIEYLTGSISCKHEDKLTKCKLSLPCNQTTYLCENEECELDHILNTGDNTNKCRFSHNIEQCIVHKRMFEGQINCTKNTKNYSEIPKQKSQVANHTGTVSCTDSFRIATICLGVFLSASLIYAVITTVIIYKNWSKLNICGHEGALQKRKRNSEVFDAELQNMNTSPDQP